MIYLENSFFDKRWNDLEIWLREKGYSDKLVWKQILEDRKFPRTELLNNQIKNENKEKPFLNITHSSSVAQLKNIMTKTKLLLTPDNEHNVFRDVPIIGFRRAKSYISYIYPIYIYIYIYIYILKEDILVRAKYLKLKTKVSAALVKNLDVKFANILYLLGISHHLIQNKHMRLGQKI